jgi:hypothetical protein
MAEYDTKMNRIKDLMTLTDEKQAANDNYLERQFKKLKCKSEKIPADVPGKRKLLILAHAIEIFGCRKCPDVDTMNESVGE